jgi:hypothetical protein
MRRVPNVSIVGKDIMQSLPIGAAVNTEILQKIYVQKLQTSDQLFCASDVAINVRNSSAIWLARHIDVVQNFRDDDRMRSCNNMSCNDVRYNIKCKCLL